MSIDCYTDRCFGRYRTIVEYILRFRAFLGNHCVSRLCLRGTYTAFGSTFVLHSFMRNVLRGFSIRTRTYCYPWLPQEASSFIGFWISGCILRDLSVPDVYTDMDGLLLFACYLAVYRATRILHYPLSATITVMEIPAYMHIWTGLL
jgi:hypothetical protein